MYPTLETIFAIVFSIHAGYLPSIFTPFDDGAPLSYFLNRTFV